MPNYYQFLRKTDGQPECLAQVDARLCEMAGVPVDPVRWYENWEMVVGLALACGRDLEEIRKELEGDALEEVCAFLQQHYTVRAWSAYGARR